MLIITRQLKDKGDYSENYILGVMPLLNLEFLLKLVNRRALATHLVLLNPRTVNVLTCFYYIRLYKSEFINAK